MQKPARKALILGLSLGKVAQLARPLSSASVKVWVASGDQDDLSALPRDDHIFEHKLFAGRIASVHEVFEAIDAHPGALDFVLFEAGNPEAAVKADKRIADAIRVALITVISQSIRRMVPLAHGRIYVHDNKPEHRGSKFPALFSKVQTVEKLVEGAAAEAKAAGIKIEYLSAVESLSEIDYLTGPAEALRVEREQEGRKQLLY